MYVHMIYPFTLSLPYLEHLVVSFLGQLLYYDRPGVAKLDWLLLSICLCLLSYLGYSRASLFSVLFVDIFSPSKF